MYNSNIPYVIWSFMAEFGSWNGCKPGSVPACYKRMPISHDRCSHLTIDRWPIHPSGSFPAGWCPYQISGCSLVAFTSFHFVRFQTNSVTVALSGYSQRITLDLAWFLRRQRVTLCPPLQMARTLRASQHRASLDFPQLLSQEPRLLTISCFIFYQLHS